MKRSNGGWEPYLDGKFTAEDGQIQFDGNCVFDISSLDQDTSKPSIGVAGKDGTDREEAHVVRLITPRDLPPSKDEEKERKQGK